MQQIRDIFSQCDTALQVVINNYNDAIDQYTDSIEADKPQVKKLRAITKAFTSLVADSKETSCIFRLLYSECEKQPRNNKTISNLQNEYDRCKNRTFMQIGYLNQALSSHLNNQNATDNYMLKSENMTKLNEMLVSTELLDDLETHKMDLLQELEEESTYKPRGKMPKSASTTSMKSSKPTKPTKHTQEDLPDLEDVDDLFEDNDTLEEPDDSDDFGNGDDDASEEILENFEKPENKENDENDETDEPFGSEIPEDSIFGDAQIKEGGLNDNSDTVVSAGGATHVVGEKYKTFVRDTFLRMRNAEDREEQVKIMGQSNEEDLDKMAQQIDGSYALDLISQSGVSEVFIASLDNLEDRVKSRYGAYKQSSKKDSKTDTEYKKILVSIGKVRIDPLHWANILIINDDLRKHIDATLAGHQKDFVKQNINTLKACLLDTHAKMKEIQKIKDVRSPEPWNKEFTIDVEHGDPIKRLITIQKRWVKIMVEVELYLGKSAEYLDSLWSTESPNLADLKYRVYLFSKLKDQTHKKMIDQLIKKFNIGEYTSLKDLVNEI